MFIVFLSTRTHLLSLTRRWLFIKEYWRKKKAYGIGREKKLGRCDHFQCNLKFQYERSFSEHFFRFLKKREKLFFKMIVAHEDFIELIKLNHPNLL